MLMKKVLKEKTDLSEANKTINVSSVQIPLTDKIIARLEGIMKEINSNV